MSTIASFCATAASDRNQYEAVRKISNAQIEITDVPKGAEVEVCLRYGNGGKLDLTLPAPVSISCAMVDPDDVTGSPGIQIKTACNPTGSQAIQKFLKAYCAADEDH